MAGLAPGIHVLFPENKTWMAGPPRKARLFIQESGGVQPARFEKRGAE